MALRLSTREGQHNGSRTFPFPCTQNLPHVPFAHDETGKSAVQGPQKKLLLPRDQIFSGRVKSNVAAQRM